MQEVNTEMNLCLLSVTTLFSFIFIWNPIDGSYIGDVAINCGYHGNSTAIDGRQWFGDVGSRSAISVLQPRGKSTSSTADHRSLSGDPIPYMTARISASQFYYTFQVNPGQKFIRLHFYPSSYRGFEKSRDFFTVKAGPFTLLRNFSALLAADAMGVKYIIKEFCVNVEEKKYLNLTFSPSQSAKQRNIYAFVNGIEIISMPTGLYYTPDGDLGARIVGQNNRYYHIDDSTALEMVQRLNIGGSSILPVEDSGMFRRWTEDADYLLESKLRPVNHLAQGINTGTYTFTAPLKICHTSWKTDENGRADKMYNFTWKIPVDLGFGYLVRLHFCDFGLVVTEGRRMDLTVLINNQIAETKADVIKLSCRTGVPVYRDYMVMVKGDEEVDKYDLFVALRSSDELAIGLLRGLEIFKVSNLDNNLASKNHVYLKQVSASWNLKIRNLLLAFDRKNAIATGITILLILLNLIVYELRQNWKETCHEETETRSLPRKQYCHRFSLAEMISATQNFSNAFLIGRGGFGNVYNGFICGGSEIVAVKRLKSNSKQGAHEFWTEIETLSEIRHKHLVSLIGYCNEYQEMILVYEYMPHGTLADNLYKIARKGNDGTSLTWEQRLRICIGAARGLDYLHTGIEYEIIHRDVKDSNILLDENLVAKISDFGLSKLANETQGYLSTKVKGTPGFLDPDYCMTHTPTRKTDVYAFGIVMLVVLCARPAVDRIIPWEPLSLLFLFRESMKKGGVNDIVDASMQGEISTESLKEFIRTVENCLHTQPKERPTMSQVVTSLEYALEKQQSAMSSKSEEAAVPGQPCDDGVVQSFSASPLHQESHASCPEDGIAGEVVGEFIPPPKRGRIKKPLMRWPWEAFWKRRAKLSRHYSSSGLSEDLRFPRFTISQIREATDNFSSDRIITDGGPWMVYKGCMFGGSEIVAIKRFKLNSRQGAREFCTEIETLYKIRHVHLVSLIGYCNQNQELILVYEYASRGTLADNIYKNGRNANDGTPLTWEQRLRICIGAARGLDYLHSCEIIHGDLADSKILLSENLVAKIADFGLSRLVGEPESPVTTGIIGTIGYLDPAYYLTVMLTKKSDVYSFGVVLLVVLCGRPVFIPRETRETLVQLFQDRITGGGDIDDIVDPFVKGEVSSESLKEYVKSVEQCLLPQPDSRPTMSLLVESLEHALEEQQSTMSFRSEDSADSFFSGPILDTPLRLEA